MPVVLHVATARDGHQYLVVETTPPMVCAWYVSRRLDLVEADGTEYYRINGRNVLRRLKSVKFDDIRSSAADAEYRAMIARLSGMADKLAAKHRSGGDAPPGAVEVTADALDAAARVAAEMKKKTRG